MNKFYIDYLPIGRMSNVDATCPGTGAGCTAPPKNIFSEGSEMLNFSCYNKTYNIPFEHTQLFRAAVYFDLRPEFCCLKTLNKN